MRRRQDVADALRAALAAPQPEPVDARKLVNDFARAVAYGEDTDRLRTGDALVAALGQAPQAQQPLTDEQIIELWLPINRDAPHASNGALQIARAIEAHHKIGVKP